MQSSGSFSVLLLCRKQLWATKCIPCLSCIWCHVLIKMLIGARSQFRMTESLELAVSLLTYQTTISFRWLFCCSSRQQCADSASLLSGQQRSAFLISRYLGFICVWLRLLQDICYLLWINCSIEHISIFNCRFGVKNSVRVFVVVLQFLTASSWYLHLRFGTAYCGILKDFKWALLWLLQFTTALHSLLTQNPFLSWYKSYRLISFLQR